jgi:type II secretory pathway pseudopilin PulG
MSVNRIAIFNQVHGKQRGAALLIMLVMLVIGIAAVLVNSLTSSTVNTARQEKTAAALAQAKDALIGYAVTYGDTHSGQVHGYLPCPDNAGGNPEGSAEPNCGTQDVSVIGRLPWATLDLPTLRDGNGECLWYAVSGTYKNMPKTGLMNWDTNGQFQAFASDSTLITTDSGNQVVAVIFAPGAAQTGQDRSGTTAPVCGGNYTAANYLDSGTVNSISFNNTDIATGKFIQGASGGVINDQMVFITRQDIWNAIQKRNDFQSTSPNNVLYNMAQAAAACLASAGSPTLSFPYYNPPYFSNTNGWIPPANTLKIYNSTCATLYTTWNHWWSNWNDHLFYANNSPTVKTSSYDAVVIFANQKLTGQTRSNAIPDNYLEGSNLTSFKTGGTVYQTSPASSTFNDILFCITNGSSTVSCP